MRVFEKNSNIFNLLSEAVSEGIIVVNREQKIVAANDLAHKLFRYQPDELLGRPLEILIPDAYRKTRQKFSSNHFNKLENPKAEVGLHLIGRRKNDEQFPMEVSLNPFSLFGNTYTLALVIDMTERREIAKSYQMKTAALEAALNGITITDALQEDNPIIYFNPAFQEMTGYPAAEISHRNCRFLQAGDHDQQGVKEMHDAIKNGTSCQVQLRNYKKDGTMFWNEVAINPITDENGTITHFVGIQNDISERKLVHQRIEHLIRIFDESLNELYVFDAASLRYLNANYGAQKNTGYSLEEILQLTPLDLKPDFSKAELQELIAPLLDGSEDKVKFETVHRRKNGTTYPVEAHLQSSTLGEEHVIVAIILDISDRRNYTQRLEKTVAERTEQLKKALEREKELNELKSKFLSLVSHEFKTPLSGILSSAILIGKYQKEDQHYKREKHLNAIMAGVKHLTSIVDDFLSIERIEKGGEVYRLSNFSLGKLIKEVVYNANMLLKAGQCINYPQNMGDVTVYQDERIVALTLTNLLHNAIKYSPEHTAIELKVQRSHDKIVFHIGDQGVGIPQKDQKHVFDLYFRSENVLLTEGTGIGLNIVKTHLENLGGRIYFKSKVNEGSTFTVEMPLKG